MDRLLDEGRTGPLYLKQPRIAQIVDDAICDRASRVHELHSYVVMSNHVHMLFTPMRPVSEIMQSLKRYTAREANKLLGLTGQAFWQEESYDRLVRGAAEFRKIARYIEMNPVKAGLAATAAAFPYTSAGAD